MTCAGCGATLGPMPSDTNHDTPVPPMLAPWPDASGAPIYEGSYLHCPDGREVIVRRWRSPTMPRPERGGMVYVIPTEEERWSIEDMAVPVCSAGTLAGFLAGEGRGAVVTLTPRVTVEELADFSDDIVDG